MFVLEKSRIDSSLYEIRERDEVIQEIPISFRIGPIPRHFSSIEAIKEWIETTEKKQAKQAAYRLLNRKNQSTSELQRKLAQRGFSLSHVQELIEELKRLGLLSDDDLTRALIDREMKKGYGPLYIEKKLRFLGLEWSLVRKIVDSEAQRKAIRKLYPRFKNPAAALQRRGFDGDIIFSELKNFICKKLCI